jgi:membrane-associated phospholipid phosphatase
MEALNQLEITIILFIQQWGSWLKVPLTAFTMLGEEQFYLIFMPAIFWCFDAILGIRIGIILLLSNGVNSFFKLCFHSPRPYWVDSRVRVLYKTETSFGLPSGHAQNAASVWGMFAIHLKQKWQQIIVIAVIFLIGFSRILLGVHFLSDVLLGWLIGALVLMAVTRLEKPLLRLFRGKTLRRQIVLAFTISILMIVLVFIPLILLSAWQLPVAWQQTSEISYPGSLVDPLNPEGVFSASGTLFGMAAGLIWLHARFAGFNPAGSPTQKIMRYIIGLAGVFIFWYGLGAVFPRDPGILSYALRYLRYALVGIWVTAGAPILFFKAGIARPGWASFDQPIHISQ